MTVTGPDALPFAAGMIAVTEVGLTTVILVAGVVLNLTKLVPVRFVPVIVTVLPPAIELAIGDMLVICGNPAKVYAFCLVMLPPAALTATKEVPPSGYAGVSTVIEVSLKTYGTPFDRPLKDTRVAPEKPAPVMFTH